MFEEQPIKPDIRSSARMHPISVGSRDPSANTHQHNEHDEDQGSGHQRGEEDASWVKVVLPGEALPVLGAQPVQPLRHEDDGGCVQDMQDMAFGRTNCQSASKQ